MTLFGMVVIASGGLVVFAGLLIVYTVRTYRDHVLYPRALSVLGLTLVAAGIGTAVSAQRIPVGDVVTLGFIAMAGVGYCLSGWLLSAAILDTDDTIHIESTTREDTGGFAGES